MKKLEILFIVVLIALMCGCGGQTNQALSEATTSPEVKPAKVIKEETKLFGDFKVVVQIIDNGTETLTLLERNADINDSFSGGDTPTGNRAMYNITADKTVFSLLTFDESIPHMEPLCTGIAAQLIEKFNGKTMIVSGEDIGIYSSEDGKISIIDPFPIEKYDYLEFDESEKLIQDLLDALSYIKGYIEDNI